MSASYAARDERAYIASLRALASTSLSGMEALADGAIIFLAMFKTLLDCSTFML